MMQKPPQDDFLLKETNPHLGGGKITGDKLTSTYDLVEQMQYLYVRVVKAKDLPAKDVTGSCDPYVEVKLGNYKGTTRHFEKKTNPEWNQVFAFSKERIQASVLEVTVKDKDLVKDDFIGRVFFDMNEIPKRVPPDSPLAPQWYRLEDRKGDKFKGELMLAVWMGTQADEAFPEAWHSDAATITGTDSLANIRSKVYLSPKLWYLRVNVIEAQDLVPSDKGRYPEVYVKAVLGNQVLRTRVSPSRSINPMWNEDLMFVASEPFEEPLILSVEDRIAPNKDEVLGRCTINMHYVDRRLDHNPVNTKWFNLEKHVVVEGEKKKEIKFASRIHMRICLEGGYHVLDESTHYSSDLRPTAKQLWKHSIGVLELGILNAQGLMPMKAKDGRGTTDAYCVAKYGQKWVRTRTIIDSFTPKWNEQYTWEVFDPCTVITIGVFDNCHLHGGDKPGGSRDSRIGKVRIRLSTLETDIDTKVSTSGSEEDANDIKKNDKKTEMPQSDLSRTDVPDMHLEPANVVTSTTAHWVDTTLRLCFEDDGTAQCTFSGAQFVDAGSQSCSNVVSVLHEGSLTDVSAAKVSVRSSADVGQRGVSQRNEKNRKSSAPQLELCSPVESDADEGPVFAGNSTSGMEVPSNSGDSLTLPKGEDVVSDMDSLCTSDLLLAQKGITALLENGSAGEHLSSVASIKDAFEVDGLKDVQSHLAVEELAVKKVTSHSLLESVGEDIINTTPVMVGGRNQNNSMDIDAVEGAKVDIDAAEEQVGIESVTDHCQIPSKLQTQYLDENMPSIDVDDGGFHGAKNDSPCTSNNPSSFGDGFGVSFTNSGDELMEIVPETLSDRGSPETLPDVMGTSLSKNSVERIHENDDKIPAERPVINVGSDSSMSILSSQNAKVVLNLDHAAERDQLLTGKTGHLASQDSKITTQMPNAKSGDLYGKKNHSSHPISKIYSGRSSFVFTASKSSASSSRISKTRTWHRNDNCSDAAPPSNKAFSSTVPAQRQFPRKADKSQRTSYIRKGNSLVRKPTSVAQSPGPHALSSSVYQLNSSGTDEPKKSAGSDSRIDLADPLNVLRTGGMDASFEKPRTPSLSSVSKISNRASNSLGGRASSPLAEHLHSLCTETVTVPTKLLESNDVPKSSDDVLKISESPITQNSQISNLECHSDPNDGNTVALANGKSLTYVKRKSNQLVASSNPCASSVQNAHNTSSDSYYKRRKNQLIRTSLESQIKQTASIPDESLNSEGQTALNSFSRNFSKRRLRKVVTRTCKPSKLSLVWTLHGAQLSKNDGDSSHCGKVLPHLFPWKRATYRRSSLPNSSSISDHSSLSTIGRKLLLLRKRNTEYTRSKHGFSLRKSKVLSVGGSSLKWSKSIEKHSKKANEEATLAVAAAERKKREQRGAAHVACPTKSRNISRERIFRVGSVRYKMDSSRRTLQRISDDESSCAGALQKEKDAKKLYIPRRLMIGKDEYVRIGNGNQLIRDPKKRTRILASEKVRWSLHTARSRLARKRKYCQFFTRFGKCNKDDGKCPFIHDSSKIAVCTKFLNGLCFNHDCKLTHKVIPERMPDCSYFLQGLCTNKNCPYRHVHVNPNASTCEGFLRGYCADGNECPKKHSYVCPSFEAIGSCPQGSKCKLHHPKNRTKEKKSKRSRENNAQGRYFGLMHISATKTRNAVPGKLYGQDNDTICFEGIADYISLDVSDEEVVENNNPGDLHTAFGDSDPMNLQLGDLDKLIKPVRIMNI